MALNGYKHRTVTNNSKNTKSARQAYNRFIKTAANDLNIELIEFELDWFTVKQCVVKLKEMAIHCIKQAYIRLIEGLGDIASG